MKIQAIVAVLALACGAVLAQEATTLPATDKAPVKPVDGACPPGQLPVSVEGGETGCASIPICVGGFPDGNCPEGSVCGTVKTGVPGCKKSDEPSKPTDGPSSDSPSGSPSSGAPSTESCAALACSLADFSTLCAAVKQADVASALTGNTVFAPTNEAFTSSGIDSKFLETVTKEALTSVLAYHVVKGRVPSSALADQLRVPTLQGANVTFALPSGSAFVNQAGIVKTDVEASDCTIHVINSVLLPPAGNIVEVLSNKNETSTLVKVASDLGLGPVVSSTTLTLLAPTNEAFAAISNITATLTPDQIRGVLTYHAIPSVLFSGPLVDGSELATVNGLKIKVKKNADGVFFNDAKVVEANLGATNGVIHVIDKVLIPPSA